MPCFEHTTVFIQAAVTYMYESKGHLYYLCCRCEAFTYEALESSTNEAEKSVERAEGVRIKPDPENHVQTGVLASAVSVGS